VAVTARKEKVRPLYASWAETPSAHSYVILLPDTLASRGHGNLCPIQPISARPVQADRDIPGDAYGALAAAQDFRAAMTFYPGGRAFLARDPKWNLVRFCSF
jgi:hypothetical protein